MRAILLNKVLRGLWFVLIPLVMRIINRSYKQSIGTTPHRLIHWAPTDLDREQCTPFRESEPIPAANSDYVSTFGGHLRVYSYRAGEVEIEV